MLRFASFTVVIAGLFIAGCGGGAAGRVDVFPVSGVVKFNGAPVIGAFVAFSPKDGQPAATSRTDDNGKYELTTYEIRDGAAAGNFSVVIKKYMAQESGTVDLEAGHSTDVTSKNMGSGHDAKPKKQASDELLPPAYGNSESTPLKALVEAGGSNTFDFNLE